MPQAQETLVGCLAEAPLAILPPDPKVTREGQPAGPLLGIKCPLAPMWNWSPGCFLCGLDRGI